MNKFILAFFCFLFLLSSAHLQKYFCIADSVPVYKDKDLNSSVVGQVNKNDSVLSFKVTKHHGSVTTAEEHLSEIFTWAQVKTNHIRGWVPSSRFVKKLYAKPTFNLWNFDTYDNADKVYHIGWSKDGKYYAYMVSGYIDGGLDGLTVRFYVIDVPSGLIKEEITTYTSYETPMDDAWSKEYGSIQFFLNQYGIIQDTGKSNLKPIPVKTTKNALIEIRFEINDEFTSVIATEGITTTPVAYFHHYIASVYCLGWLKCPYDKNKYIVYTTANTGSSEFYVQAFAIDRKRFVK